MAPFIIRASWRCASISASAYPASLPESISLISFSFFSIAIQLMEG
jgi:hypothetical protein